MMMFDVAEPFFVTTVAAPPPPELPFKAMPFPPL